MSKLVANRIEQVQAPVIPIVGRWTAENPGTISLGQGVVHYPPPPEVFEAVAKAAVSDRSLDRYGDVCGRQPLIDLIEQKLAAENDIHVNGNSAVVCTAGSNMAFMNAVLAIADVDDEIILLSPYYFNHHMAVEIAGCRPVIAHTTPEYQLDVDAIRSAISPKTRAVVTISPNNPTGAVYPKDDLMAVNQLCDQHGIYHISDEAYEYFVYGDAQHFSPGSISGADKHTISMFSLSKAYGMAGWRTGYMLVPTHLVTPIKKIQDTNLICPPIVGQIAAAAALDVGSNWCRNRLSEFEMVRGKAIDELSELEGSCHLPVPQGAFYGLMQLPESGIDDMDLVERLIREYRVAVLPGSAFGDQFIGAIRFSYGALDAATVIEGIGRLKRGLSEILDAGGR